MLIGLDGNEANVENRVGSGVYSLELLKQFSRLKNHDFRVYLKEKPLPDLPGETSYYAYKVFGPKKLWTQFALPFNLTFGNKPEVFFSMGHYGPRFSQVPYVITVHDLSYLRFPDLFKKEDLYQLTNWTKYSVKYSAHIIAVSKTTKNDIEKNYNVSGSKISVTYEGFDKGKFKPQPKTSIESVKKKYGITGEYIIFVGTLQPRKNIERLIEAFCQIGVQIGVKPLKLVICGRKGWMYGSILHKAREIGTEKKVIFTDFVPDKYLPALISGAKAYVLPSLWEGFGIPVIEAQACGVPVVVSNNSSLPEVVDGSGILVDPNSIDSIAQGIKKSLDPPTRSSLVEKGARNIRRFSWEKCAEETMAVLERVAQTNKPIVE